MKIRWYGQANILIESSGGIKIQCDPYDDTLGYRIPDFKPDIVTVSHNHFDHNGVEFTKGDPETVREPGDFNIKGIDIKGVELFHDNTGGRKRGKNIVYKLRIDNMDFIHMGDIGHVLSTEIARRLKPCDIVAVPVGGRYTVGGKEAADIVRSLAPSVVIPIHYDTPSNRLGLNGADQFLKEFMEIRRSRFWQGARKDLKKEVAVEVLMALGEFNHD
jgi:L-ascorbate metabolism protein UlaG (beta-lactamase superfamily)